MIQCPKCRSVWITGPQFHREAGRERLRFRCMTCGYWQDEQTAEQQEQAVADKDAWAREHAGRSRET